MKEYDMDEERLKLIESLAQKIIINMVHFTKPEYREQIDDEDSWIGAVDSVTKAMSFLLQLYSEVVSKDVLVKLEDEENTILRRGFFRSMAETSEAQQQLIDRILQGKDIDLRISQVVSLTGQLQEAIESLGNQKTVMENLAQSQPSQASELRDIERLHEGLIELATFLSQLQKTLSKSMKLVASIDKKARKKLKQVSKARSKKREKV
jgi:hypothetical protein